MRIIRTSIAALALTLAVPVAAQAATITVGAGATPAGDSTPFSFHVTGPACGTTPTDITFSLTDGQTKLLTLCDSPPDLAHRFHVTERVPSGWTLTSIDCTGTDPDPDDAFVVDLPTATAFVELSPNEDKACTFRNAAPPPSPPSPPAPSPPAPSPSTPSPAAPPSTAGSSPTGAAPTTTTPPAAQQVAAEQVSAPARPAARLGAQTRCGVRTARVTVRSRLMRRVTFSVNGRRVRTLNVPRGALRVTTLVPLRRSGAAVQRVRARVTFRNGARPRTLSAAVRRCAQTGVAPQFTG
jgi:hypothetical protein